MRLYDGNLLKEYQKLGTLIEKKSLGGHALLQRNYGKAQDCTITSLAFLYGESRYGDIEKIALRYGYNGDKRGTNPFVIKAIMNECSLAFGVRRSAQAAYGKGAGFNFEKVKRIIDDGCYVLLNLWKDGRGYYSNHTVTIVGYRKYEHGVFFEVFDNWSPTVSLIDYGKLCAVSSINWLK